MSMAQSGHGDSRSDVRSWISGGAAIAAQGQPRPGGYRYYQNACYQQRPDGAWLVVSPEYCAPPGEPVAVAPPPPPRYHDELGDA